MEEEKKAGAAPAAPPKPEMCSNGELFQFLKGADKAMIIGGTLAAISAGVAMPMFVFFFGKLTDSFNPGESGESTLRK